MRRRVVAEQDQFDALHAHDAIGLRPAPVVADAHADIAAEGAPDRKAEIARLEIALLEMLKRIVRPVVGVAGQMHLAVFADDRGILVHQDRGVVAVGRAVLLRKFGVAEIEADAERLCGLEQRPRRRARHFAFEKAVESPPHHPSTSAERTWSARARGRPRCRCRALWPRASVQAAATPPVGATRCERSAPIDRRRR